MTSVTTSQNCRRILYLDAIFGAPLFDELLNEWRRSGYLVNVLYEVTDKAYRNSTGFFRLWLRIRVNIIFPLRIALRIFLGSRQKGEIVVVTSTPFFAPAIVGMLKRRYDRVVHMLYDLYPEAAVVAGKVRAGSIVERIMASITCCSVRSCDVTVYLGERLRQHAENCYGPSRYPVVIPVGTTAGMLSREALMTATNGPVTIVYVGNYGYLHDVDTLADLLRTGLPPGLRLAFYANGAGFERLKETASEWPVETRERVEFGGALNNKCWAEVMGNSQVGLVLFAREAEKVAFPSKTFSAMAAGQAIVAVTPSDSDLADVIREDRCGWFVEPGDVAGLRNVLERLVQQPAELLAARKASQRAGVEKYDLHSLASRWTELFEELRVSVKEKC